MKEALLILTVIAVLLGLTAFRYRRQLETMLHIWRMFRNLRNGAKSQNEQIASEPVKTGQLVNCVRCRLWVYESGAIKLGKGTFFCSAECVERSSQTASK